MSIAWHSGLATVPMISTINSTEVQNGNVFHSVFLCGNVRGCLRDAVMDGTNFFHQTRKENQKWDIYLLRQVKAILWECSWHFWCWHSAIWSCQEYSRSVLFHSLLKTACFCGKCQGRGIQWIGRCVNDFNHLTRKETCLWCIYKIQHDPTVRWSGGLIKFLGCLAFSRKDCTIVWV